MTRIARREASQEEAARQKEIIGRLGKRLEGQELTYHLSTFGCQMNFHDSEKLRGILEEIGYRESADETKADFVLYNTCAVRENAEQKVFGKIGFLKNVKRSRPHMLLALCGCMMQQEGVVQTLKRSHRHIDLVFGTHNLYRLAELLEARMDSDSPIYDIWDSHQEIVEDLPTRRTDRHKASVNIMYGCNNFCTYCIVPYVRGRERSRNPEEILEEIRHLAADGVVEVMLLGQNVNSYGRGLPGHTNFARLLEEIEKVEGIRRIRFMTSHPKDLSEDLIRVLGASSKICPQLHLPFQSGSSRILERMNRGYTKESYLELIRKMKAAVPELALTTDIIVGFPGETEEDFLHTLDVVDQVGYDLAYTFLYSKRTGTPAASMGEQVEEEVAKERFNRLLALCNRQAYDKSAAHVGKVFEVLVEAVNDRENGILSGRLANNHLVHFSGAPAEGFLDRAVGTFLQVKVTGAKSFYLTGEAI
ncbi:tRNA (N6-isopentenyl adenosine(37)-C2)-methylthiotransferase MiaB [Anaerotalea alkaliphila]|uniref:tRNA-2-methylthio-N(6)-dimethylallyladenosine synthase n=1 Tax=Anaerotalea alkaliphila TaxID=2662126 RepID=A0A7X5HWW7_9FIRM|nr:tRNA (N6-isopentenyl adenosine(37)-C2)-methylthiotransferase MiaB [Anaerotalea alkaliphila]NDL68165.1 tRNA (N6-isopentenyl adenosine(37)-C2)-methylthiotransferase MiaB [Anaerotalea alkaliphila]